MALKKPQNNYWRSLADGQWYWNTQGRNGKIQASGEGYATESNLKRGIRRLKWNFFIAKLVRREDH